MNSSSRIIVALDYANPNDALKLVSQLEPSRCKLKIGKELFTRVGPDFVRDLVKKKFDLFLDLKFHDIPNTVARACAAAAELGVWMVNVHALGGRNMLLAAHEALQQRDNPPLLIAVTLLTSMSQTDLLEVGLTGTVDENVSRLAHLTHQCGLDGVVCSALEAKSLRNLTNTHFKLVTPGIRFADSATEDQKRIATPQFALEQGADYLVVCRPITQATNPMAVIERIEEEINSSAC